MMMLYVKLKSENALLCLKMLGEKLIIVHTHIVMLVLVQLVLELGIVMKLSYKSKLLLLIMIPTLIYTLTHKMILIQLTTNYFLNNVMKISMVLLISAKSKDALLKLKMLGEKIKVVSLKDTLMPPVHVIGINANVLVL